MFIFKVSFVQTSSFSFGLMPRLCHCLCCWPCLWALWGKYVARGAHKWHQPCRAPRWAPPDEATGRHGGPAVSHQSDVSGRGRRPRPDRSRSVQILITHTAVRHLSAVPLISSWSASPSCPFLSFQSSAGQRFHSSPDAIPNQHILLTSGPFLSLPGSSAKVTSLPAHPTLIYKDFRVGQSYLQDDTVSKHFPGRSSKQCCMMLEEGPQKLPELSVGPHL